MSLRDLEIQDPRRFGVIAVSAVVVLLVLIFSLRSCDSGDTPSSGSGTTAATSAPPRTDVTTAPGTEPGTSSTTAPPTTAPTSTTTTVVPAPKSVIVRPKSTPAVAWWQEQFPGGSFPDPTKFASWDNPNNSDLPPSVAAGLAEDGHRLLWGHLTGQQRELFDAYFASVPPRDQPAGNVTVYGAAAAKDDDVAKGWARVAVLWGGDVPGADGAVSHIVMFSEFEFSPENGWHPVHCADSPNADKCNTGVLAVQPLP